MFSKGTIVLILFDVILYFVVLFYIGGRTSDDIINWLKKKTGPPAKELATVEAAKEFVDANNVAVIGFFKDQTTDDAKAFLDVASSIDDIPFGLASDDAVCNEFSTKCGHVMLFKKVSH